MKKISSILDYSYPSLDPAIWSNDMKLHTYQKDFILRLLNTLYTTYNLKQPELWVEDIVIIGSLTTSKWLLTSDLDVHVRVDIEAFKNTNMPQATIQEAFTFLDETRKKFDRAKILAPMTQHPVEYYFESLDIKPSNITMVGVYSILQDKWLKEPVIFPADLDYEESKKDVIAQAEALAQTIDVSLGKIQRDIQRIDELETVVKSWDREKQQLFYSKVEKKLFDIETEIAKDLQIRRDLVDARHAGQDATSDTEIKFKWLARFGFFSILGNLKTLMEETGGKVTTQELPLIDKIISEGSVVVTAGLSGYGGWISPTGEFFEVDDHANFVRENPKLFGMEEVVNRFKNDRYNQNGAIINSFPAFINNGWCRVRVWGDKAHIQAVNFSKAHEAEDFIFTVLDQVKGIRIETEDGKFYETTSDEFKEHGFEAFNRGSLIEAFLKDAFDKMVETDICVDLDKTIAKPAKYPEIGEPIEGAKEALEKLKDLGYDIVIYSCRADSEEDVDLIREYLDKHDIPYDSIFEGKKPFAKFYIDDHAIKFDNWDNVLKQVEKSEKKASLYVSAAEAYYHGGSGSSIRQIAKDGYVVAPLETGRKLQSPLAGKAYLTTDLGYALIYALGANMVGSKSLDPRFTKDLEGGVVLVAPNDDALIPDEDWLGERLTSGFQGESNSIYDTLKPQQALQPVFNNMAKQNQNRLYDANYHSMIGKMAIRILQNYNPDYLNQIAKEAPHLSHEGNMKVLQAWVFDKARDNPKLKPDGSNFFQVAQEIPVTKTASLKIANLSDKYWIDPAGKEYVTSGMGHNEWAARNVLKMSDEDIRNNPDSESVAFEAANDMLAKGWTRITTESDHDFAVEVNDINNLPGYLDNFVAQHYTGDGLEIDDAEGNTVVVDDPFPSIQKQVNRALRQQQTIAKAFSKKDITAKLSQKYWIDPSGTEYPVDDKLGHQGWVGMEILRIPTVQELKENEETLFDESNKLIANGWTRITTESDYDFAIEVADINNLPSYLDNFIAKHYTGGGIEIDDLNGDYQDVDDPFPSLRKAIYQAKRLRNAASLFSKKDITAKLNQKYWVDPSGKEYSFNSKIGHYGWVWRNRDLLILNYGVDPTEIVSTAQQGDVGDWMIANGWTRITTESDHDFAVEVNDINNLPSYLDNFVANHYAGGGIEISDKNGEYQDLSDPFPSLRKAIYQAKRLRNAASLFSKKDIIANTNLIEVGTVRGINISVPEQLLTSYISTIKYFQTHPNMSIEELEDNDRERSSIHNSLVSYVLKNYNFNVEDTLLVNETNKLWLEIANMISQFAEDVVYNPDKEAVQKQAKTKKVKQGDYSCIMASIPHGIAQEIIEFGVREIPDKDLYLDEEGNLGRELEAHVTIMYGLLTDDAKSVRRSFDDSKPFKAKLGKVRHFQPPERDFDVVTVEVISDDLDAANKMIDDKFDCADDLPSSGEYKPHITIAYVKRDIAKKHIGSDEFEGIEVELDTLVFSPHKGNKTYFSIGTEKKSSFVLEKINKLADFLPSLTTPAPDNDWQFAAGGDDKEIPVDPDAVSDETTWYAPCTVGKPRSKDVWRQFLSMFSNPFSKKEEIKVDAVYDKELEDANKDALGEDETALDYSKGFYDPKKHDFPHNTTWLNTTYQDQEPSKPLPVTYSPQISNEDNLDQNSSGGYPRRFMGKPKGEWFSNEGEVNNALIQMLKNREAAINALTIDITADLAHAYWIDPAGKVFQVRGSDFDRSSFQYGDTHEGWVKDNLEMLKSQYGLEPYRDGFTEELILSTPNLLDAGWIRIGDSMDNAWGLSVKDSNNIPSYVDNVLAQFAHDGASIEIDDRKGVYTKIEWPVKSVQQAVNRARRQPVAASVNKTAITKNYALYINNVAYPAVRTLTRMKALRICKERFPEAYTSRNYEIRHEEFKTSSLKQAGINGANSYWLAPDGNEFFVPYSHQTWINENSDYLKLYNIDSTDKNAWNKMIQSGWVRISPDSNTDQPGYSISLLDIHSIPSILEDFVAKHPPVKGQQIYIEDGKDWIDVDYSDVNSLQQGINRAFQRKRLGKQASIENVNGVKVLVNPTEQEFRNFSLRLNMDGHYMMRGLLDPHSGDLFVWDAYFATHTDMIPALGLDIKYDEDSPWCLYFPQGQSSIFEVLRTQRDYKNNINKSKKTAGDQSASVPDYLINEWKTEQINNDTDEEPYVNHDQRDYPYGMHDSPENTGTGIGWPKDNQPYVVRLDILENPAYRLDPFGIGEYNVTYYTAMPMSDGIESVNFD